MMSDVLLRTSSKSNSIGGGGGGDVVIQATALSRKEENEVYLQARDIKGGRTVRFLRNLGGPLDPSTTHLVVAPDRIRRTEKLLSAIAAGSVWILTTNWLRECAVRGEVVDEARFDLGSDNGGGDAALSSGLFIAHHEARSHRKMSGGGVFKGWSVVVAAQDASLRQKLGSILKFGGATVNPWTLRHVIDSAAAAAVSQPLHLQGRELTLIVMDPAIVGQETFDELYQLKKCSPFLKRVPLVSYTYVEEYLTSAHPPSVSTFNVVGKEIRKMHSDGMRLFQDLPPPDVRFHGSPCLSLQPLFVSHRLQLKSRLEIPKERRRDNLSVSASHHLLYHHSLTPPSISESISPMPPSSYSETTEEDKSSASCEMQAPMVRKVPSILEEDFSLSSWLEKQMAADGVEVPTDSSSAVASPYAGIKPLMELQDSPKDYKTEAAIRLVPEKNLPPGRFVQVTDDAPGKTDSRPNTWPDRASSVTFDSLVISRCIAQAAANASGRSPTIPKQFGFCTKPTDILETRDPMEAVAKWCSSIVPMSKENNLVSEGGTDRKRKSEDVFPPEKGSTTGDDSLMRPEKEGVVGKPREVISVDDSSSDSDVIVID